MMILMMEMLILHLFYKQNYDFDDDMVDFAFVLSANKMMILIMRWLILLWFYMQNDDFDDENVDFALVLSAK